MRGDVTKVNVQEPRMGVFQKVHQRAKLAGRNLPRFIPQLAKPKAAQKMQRRFWDNVDLIKWKAGRIFPFLSDDNGRDALERGDLPVDVPHLRFQKRRAITGDDGERIRFDV